MALTYLTPIDLSGNEIRNFAHQAVAVLPDATTRAYQILAFDSALYWSNGVIWLKVGDVSELGAHSISELGAPTADLSMATYRITNLGEATDPGDAASLAVVRAEVAKVVDSSPELLDTLRELAEALNNDPDFANNILASLGELDTRIAALENGTSGALARKFAGDVGDGVATDFALVHQLNTTDVAVSLYDAATRAMVITEVAATDADTITLTFATAPATGAYRAVIVG